ncbi:MAG: uracil-DNA glycosylase, partial [Candidatus Competibacterales bacterium]
HPLPHWPPAFATHLHNDKYPDLQALLAAPRRDHHALPPQDEVFSAFALTPFEEVEVLILGQDPYHDDGQAHGLSFSVKPGVAIPPSLKNIYQERHADLGLQPPDHGHLSAWARRGVLLLNAVLTVRAHTPNSHKGRGWETLTDRVIRLVSQHRSHVGFVLWGVYAKKKAPLIDGQKHTILQSAHPSPLSARNGFFGSRPFSSINAALAQNGQDEVDWTLPEIP